MGPGPTPGPGRLGQKLGCLRRAGAESKEKRAQKGGAEAFWPPKAPVGPRSPGPRPAASPAGSSRAPPRTGPRPAAAALPRAPALQAPRAVRMAGWEEVSVSGFEEFSRAVEQHHGKTIFAYFTGSKDDRGKSWCPDCVQGEAGLGGCCPDDGLPGPGHGPGAGREGAGEGVRSQPVPPALPLRSSPCTTPGG